MIKVLHSYSHCKRVVLFWRLLFNVVLSFFSSRSHIMFQHKLSIAHKCVWKQCLCMIWIEINWEKKGYSWSAWLLFASKPTAVVIITNNYTIWQLKLTCPVHSHWLKQTLQYTWMQDQHCNPLLRMSQSKVCFLSKNTIPLLSSQKPV